MPPLIDPQTGSSATIYDPTLPNRIVRGAPVPTQAPNTITSIDPGEGPQYNPSFGNDMSPTPAAPVAPKPQYQPPTYNPSFPVNSGVYKPSFDPNKPGVSSILAGAARRPVARSAGPNVQGIFNNLPDDTFDGAGAGGNAVQTAQAPAPATPQGWNLFAALGQALGHLLGFNVAGQPQGMSGLLRNPPLTTAAPPTQTGVLRMPAQAASRYQGRTLVG
jgi:hypothetical protein